MRENPDSVKNLRKLNKKTMKKSRIAVLQPGTFYCTPRKRKMAAEAARAAAKRNYAANAPILGKYSDSFPYPFPFIPAHSSSEYTAYKGEFRRTPSGHQDGGKKG